jgi:hypothetical protein
MLEASQYLTSKLYYRVIVFKIAWCWHKNKYEAQGNKIEDLDMTPQS